MAENNLKFTNLDWIKKWNFVKSILNNKRKRISNLRFKCTVWRGLGQSKIFQIININFWSRKYAP